MIFGHIDHLDSMRSWLPAPMLTALEYLRIADLSTLTREGTEIAPGIRATGFGLTTKPAAEAKAEIHKRNIDIQFLRTGRERIDVAADRGGNPVAEDLLVVRDALFYASVKNESSLYMEPGNFAVLFPEDIHRPGCMAGDQPEDVLKVVVKIPVELVK